MKKFTRRGASLMVYGLWFMVLMLYTIYYTPNTVYATENIGSSAIYPASPFYFLKTIREGIEMHFAQTPRVRRIRQLEFATRRLREVNSLISAKREDLISATLERYWSHVKSIPDKDPADTELVQRIQDNLSIHLETLQKMYDQVSDPTAKMFIRSTVNRIMGRADITVSARKIGCMLLVKVASSSALNEVNKEIYSDRAQKCSLILNPNTKF